MFLVYERVTCVCLTIGGFSLFIALFLLNVVLPAAVVIGFAVPKVFSNSFEAIKFKFNKV